MDEDKCPFSHLDYFQGWPILLLKPVMLDSSLIYFLPPTSTLILLTPTCANYAVEWPHNSPTSRTGFVSIRDVSD